LAQAVVLGFDASASKLFSMANLEAGHLLSELSEGAEEMGSQPEQRGRGLWLRVAAAAAGVLGVAAFTRQMALQAGSSHLSLHGAAGTIQLSGEDFNGMGEKFAQAMKEQAGQAMTQTGQTMQSAEQAWGASAQANKQAAQQTVQSAFQGNLGHLAPHENLHDSNPCADDEEQFEGLCYSKCSILTGGMKPVRCAAHICEPLDSSGQNKCHLSADAINAILSSPSLMPCQGFDVAGAKEGAKRCPHSPGSCMKDEELYLGTCFKKCSMLTNGVFPHRKAFATCCKATSLFQCLMPGYSKTDEAFTEGGGFGDHDPNTPNKAHAPMQSLTEAQ